MLINGLFLYFLTHFAHLNTWQQQLELPITKYWWVYLFNIWISLFYYGSVSAWRSWISNSLRAGRYCQHCSFKNPPHKISDLLISFFPGTLNITPNPSGIHLIWKCAIPWMFKDCYCWPEGSQCFSCSNIPKWEPNLEDLQIKSNLKMGQGLSCNRSKITPWKWRKGKLSQTPRQDSVEPSAPER